MGLLEILSLALLGIITSMLGGILRDDAKTYVPKLAQKLIFLAARRLPPHEEILYAEAWLAHLGELEERSAMLKHALQCYFIASPRLQSAMCGEETFYLRRGKRATDLMFVGAAAPSSVLIVFVFAIIAKLRGHAAFHTEERVGRLGRTFVIYKLATIHPGSDGPGRSGRFLRKTSMDELPQLYNVFRGDMSLIGPRPLRPQELDLYGNVAGYSKLRPGLTGVWQLSRRFRSCYHERAKLDSDYGRNLSFKRDFWIIVMTIVDVARGRGSQEK